jgi:hypothetical protein
LRILEQVPLGLRQETALDHQLRELQVHGRPTRRRTQYFVTQSDRIVGEALLGVPIRRSFVLLYGSADVADLEVQVAKLIEQPEFLVELRCAI